MCVRGAWSCPLETLSTVQTSSPACSISLTFLDDDTGLVPSIDSRLRVVGLSDALQFRLHLRLVLLLLRVLRRHQRVATYVVLVVALIQRRQLLPSAQAPRRSIIFPACLPSA